MKNLPLYSFAIIAVFFVVLFTPITAYAGTFGYTTGINHGVLAGTGTGLFCVNSGHTDNGSLAHIYRASDVITNECQLFATEWDISSIPDNANVTSVNVRIDVDSTGGENCDVNSIESQPSVANAATKWADNQDGTTFLDNDSWCASTGNQKILNLGAGAVSDIQSHVTGAIDWWAVGFAFEEDRRDSNTLFWTFSDVQLEVQYTAEVAGIDDLNCVFISDPNDYSVDCDWSNPTGDGLSGFNIQRHNGTSWEILVNDTGSLVSFYNDTSLDQNIFHAYNVTGWGDLGQGVGSNIQNATTIDSINGTLTTVAEIVGDTLGAKAIIDKLTGFPFGELNQITTWINGTIADTDTPSSTFEDTTIIPHYEKIGNGTTTTVQQIRVLNATGDPLLFNSTQVQGTQEYNPSYFTSIEGGYVVNYTLSRDLTQTDLNLKVNRDPINFKIECLYQDPIQAVTGNLTNGVWSNQTDVGFLDDHQIVDASDNIYITCYNDELLFTATSYTNSSQTLLGIEIYDNIYGEFLGVPVGIFFLILVAGYANQRTAPTWTVIILAMAGVLATIGFFSLDVGVWGLMLIAGMLALFVGRKVF